MNNPLYYAVIVAGGSGKRMNSTIKKQYMELDGRPLLYYSIKAFLDSDMTKVVLVIPGEDYAYVRDDILGKYDFNDVILVNGGATRIESVHNGLICLKKVINEEEDSAAERFVLIHDGARPFISSELIVRVKEELMKNGACFASVPVKDTIHIVGEDGRVQSTPSRNSLMAAQTPQAFCFDDICKAYERCLEDKDAKGLTDDVSIAMHYMGVKAKAIMGDESNIKITTRNDLKLIR